MTESEPQPQQIRYAAPALREYMIRVLAAAGASGEDAAISADVLLAADLRGVPSHGIIRLFPYYYQRMRDGLINPHPRLRVLCETPTTLALDGDNGLGHPTGFRAMQMCMEKAQTNGCAFVTVRHSNHYGIAGYYAMQALAQDMIGLSFTNAASLVAPTGGSRAVLGTNPIAVAVPNGAASPYVLDMATSIVPIGKITVYQRAGLPIPFGWGIDSSGVVTSDPDALLHGGALLPLGGTEEMRGYKGYGLALLVEILAGVLAGAAVGQQVDADPHNRVSHIGHAFAALRIDAFRSLAGFQVDLQKLIEQLQQAPKAVGQVRIRIPGERAAEATRLALDEGVPVYAAVVETLQTEGEAAGIPFDLPPLG